MTKREETLDVLRQVYSAVNGNRERVDALTGRPSTGLSEVERTWLDHAFSGLTDAKSCLEAIINGQREKGGRR